MSNNKKNTNQVDAQVEQAEKKDSVCFYPDVAFNKSERTKTITMCGILLLFLAGMGIAIFAAGLENSDNPMGWLSGLLMIIIFVLVIATLPSAFKQYPTKREPIIELKQKEITIHGETFKQSDVKEVRLTITLAPVGNKADNEKHLNAMLDKEPPKNVTANLDFAVPGPKGKMKTVYTTIENGYEALVTLYQAGYKHYSIVYSLKKLAKKATYDLGQTKTEDGKTLSSLSKKERLKQLF